MKRALAALLLVSALGTTRADIVDRLDTPAAEITATVWWNGAAPKLEALRGKVVVLHVSDPSRTTSVGFVPNLVKLVEGYRDKPVVLVEIVENEQQAVAEKYLKTYASEVRWTVGWDGAGATQRGYPGSSLPRTYVIGPDGKVAWHRHVAALTRDVLDAQVTRCGFADPKLVPEKARPAAKAMLELKFADALAAADRVFTDRYAPDDAKAFCAGVKKEISRYYAFQRAVVDALMKDLDWAVAYHRVERMLVTYRDTDHMAEIQRLKAELDANPRVRFIVEAQNRLDDMVEGFAKLPTKELEKLVLKLKDFILDCPESAPAKKAQEWIDEAERRIAARARSK